MVDVIVTSATGPVLAAKQATSVCFGLATVLGALFAMRAELAAMHGVSSKTVAYLLGQLRATPRSRIVSRAAGPQFEQTPRWRPWEIKARA